MVDGGPTGVGLESTIVDCTQPVPIVLRPGGVTREDILRVIGQVSSQSEYTRYVIEMC